MIQSLAPLSLKGVFPRDSEKAQSCFTYATPDNKLKLVFIIFAGDFPKSFLHIKLRPQINLARLGIIHQFFRDAFTNDLALVNEIRAIHQFQRFADIVVGD